MGILYELASDQPSEISEKQTNQKEKSETNTVTSGERSPTSMNSLIIWNISKALEQKPHMDLKSGIKTAQERLQSVSCDGNTAISRYPEEQYLVCALLAWQELGHTRAESLYEFIASKRSEDIQNRDSNKNELIKSVILTSNTLTLHCNDANTLKGVDSICFGPSSYGPVIKLPLETKIVMRMNPTSGKKSQNHPKCQSPKGSQASTSRSQSQKSSGSSSKCSSRQDTEAQPCVCKTSPSKQEIPEPKVLCQNCQSKQDSQGSLGSCQKCQSKQGSQGSQGSSPRCQSKQESQESQGPCAGCQSKQGSQGSQGSCPRCQSKQGSQGSQGPCPRCQSKQGSQGPQASCQKCQSKQEPQGSQGSCKNCQSKQEPQMSCSKCQQKKEQPVLCQKCQPKKEEQVPCQKCQPKKEEQVQCQKCQPKNEQQGIESKEPKESCQKCGDQKQQQPKRPTKPPEATNTTNKIKAACCMKSACSEKLLKLDAETAELRSRAEQLAKREAQRSELLERAEAAWKDLERGYQRRLTLAQEKEEEITGQIQKIIDERNEFKNSCSVLTEDLKERGALAEADRAVLKTIEAEVCQFACQRLKLNEETTRAEAALAEQQCKTVQLQRDLQFKEEQIRRKMLTMESETESARALTHETERALRAELSGLRDQINQVSNQLLEEDQINNKLKKELEDLRKEKLGMIEDLEGCKALCDGKVKGQMDELQAKRQKLQALKDKEIECRCKLPVHVAVEVKRTPSLAALCKCAPEDRILESCSCTSMKGRLLSSLLADLFGGLQSELGGTGSQMPCQLLKCLEDQHNWDRASVTKSNLRDYFSKLLVGELDIAIATSIENYHAKWVGTTCADQNIRMTPGPQDDLKEGWEKRAIERRAQKLAAQLAEELYEQRAEELTKRAKAIVTSGPPPCECSKRGPPSVYPCLLETLSPFTAYSSESNRKGVQSDKSISSSSPYWKRTHKDVTQLRHDIEDLKKAFIKREDLKLMEEKITKIVNKTAGSESEDIGTKKNAENQHKYKKETSRFRNTVTVNLLKNTFANKAGVMKKNIFATNNLPKKAHVPEKPTKQLKKPNYPQTYAVNMCICSSSKPSKITKHDQSNKDAKPSVKQNSANVITALSAYDNQTRAKGIDHSSPDAGSVNSKILTDPLCSKDCKCFHKAPSNTSIDNLLETLSKWKSDLGKPQSNPNNNIINGSKSGLEKHSKSILKKRSQIESKTPYSMENKKEHSEEEMHKNIVEAVKQNPSRLNFHEAIKTVSEYMAAVNLDKSNEYANNYADTETYKENADIEEHNTNRHPDYICSKNIIHHNDQQCANQEEKEKLEIKNAKKVLNQHLYGKTKNTTILNILNNSKSNRAINTEEYKKEVEFKEKMHQTNSNQNHGKSLSNNLDYFIKFLGVTLVDTKTQKGTKNSIKSRLDKPLSSCSIGCKNSEKVPETFETSKLASDINKSLTTDIVTEFSNKEKQCEWSTKFDEFKHFIVGIIKNQAKTKNTEYKDIALDSQSLTRSMDILGSCVCCNNERVDCAKDLEVNAFDLLEAHLKEKIKEFKVSSCQSSCISTEDEEKIFRTILKRVKQVISECANELKCNETGSIVGASKGSWQRAYGLLQEYLKMKVKRAQCLPLLSTDKDVVLTDILKKVCDLIENDFQRLKDMCKCEKTNNLPIKITLKEPLSDLCKDLTNRNGSPNKNITTNLESKFHQTLIKAITPTENVSSQVRSEVEMETKSCDARSDIRVETKSCDAMSDNKNIDNAVSTECQAPVDLEIATKSCNVSFKNDTISKANSTKFTSFKPLEDTCTPIQPHIAMETKSCDTMLKADNIVKIVSRINLANSINLSQNMASQVPPNLGMENKYCNAIFNKNYIAGVESADNFYLSLCTQSCDITEVDEKKKTIQTSNDPTAEPLEDLIYNTCNCNYSHRSQSRENLDTKTVLFNLRTDFLTSSNIKSLKDLRKHADRIQISVLENTTSLPSLEKKESMKAKITFKNFENTTNTDNIGSKLMYNNYESYKTIPYVGTTVDCICGRSIKSCTCIKSLIQDTSYKSSDNWHKLLADRNKCVKNFPYIMNSMQDKNKDQVDCEILHSPRIGYDKQNDGISIWECEDVFLSYNKKTNAIHHGINNSEKDINIDTGSEGKGQFNWLMCPEPEPVKFQTKLSTDKLSNASLYYEPVHDTISSTKSMIVTEAIESSDKLTGSLCYDPIDSVKLSRKTLGTTSDSIELSKNVCNCEKVPICHVKMLIANIERNLIESKCTCDSVSKICPVHRRIFL